MGSCQCSRLFPAREGGRRGLSWALLSTAPCRQPLKSQRGVSHPAGEPRRVRGPQDDSGQVWAQRDLRGHSGPVSSFYRWEKRDAAGRDNPTRLLGSIPPYPPAPQPPNPHWLSSLPSFGPQIHLGLPRLGLCVLGTPLPFSDCRRPAQWGGHRGQQPPGGLTAASVRPEGLPIPHRAAASCGAGGRPPAAHQPDEDGRGLWLQAGVRGAWPQSSQDPAPSSHAPPRSVMEEIGDSEC